MAGCLLDDLVDALSDDEVTNKEAPLVDAEDYMRRAIQLGVPQTKSNPANNSAESSSSGVSPEDKIDYYRRMVQMHEMMRTGGYESIADSGLPELETLVEKAAEEGKSLEVCTEFLKTGECRSGLNCRFVHEGAFRKGAVGGKDDLPVDDDVNVDPEDFIRRALHLRSQQKNRMNSGAARPPVPFQSFFGGW
jgi:hypothetical protein